MNENMLYLIEYYILVIDVKSLWDMDSQEGSKNAFAVGSKFDHLSPDHSSSLQKKVFYVIFIVNPFGVIARENMGKFSYFINYFIY